jgi:hypothetical protein
MRIVFRNARHEHVLLPREADLLSLLNENAASDERPARTTHGDAAKLYEAQRTHALWGRLSNAGCRVVNGVNRFQVGRPKNRMDRREARLFAVPAQSFVSTLPSPFSRVRTNSTLCAV